MGEHVVFLLENQPYPYDPRVRAQTRSLLDLGYDITVLSPTGEGALVADQLVDGVRVRRFRAPPGGRGLIGYLREFFVSLLRLARLLRQTVRERSVDVVVVCNPPDLLTLVSLPLARRGAAVVFDDRELSPELFETKFGRRGLAYRALLLMERWAFRHADAILVTNSSYRENVRVRGGVPDERIFVVGNGPDPTRIFPVEPRPSLRRGQEHLVLWMGAMSKQEGLERLVDVADELVNRRGRHDVAVALVGPGDVHADLGAAIEKRGLTDVVMLSGRVDDDLVRAYMATADVCVAVDGAGAMNDRAAMRKVFEYMAMARPVVQFPLREMRRLCGDTTLYANDGDVQDLANQIERLLDDPAERRRLGEAGRDRLIEMGLMWPDQAPTFVAAVQRAKESAATQADRR